LITVLCWWISAFDDIGIYLKKDPNTTSFSNPAHAHDGTCSDGEVPNQVLQALSAEIAGDDVHTSLIDRLAYASDASHYYHVPKAVIVASDIAEVAHAFRIAA